MQRKHKGVRWSVKRTEGGASKRDALNLSTPMNFAHHLCRPGWDDGGSLHQSKAAPGVLLVQTRRAQGGQLRKCSVRGACSRDAASRASARSRRRRLSTR
eukprot:58837-Chlamydomonas_euryale.AAC.2